MLSLIRGENGNFGEERRRKRITKTTIEEKGKRKKKKLLKGHKGQGVGHFLPHSHRQGGFYYTETKIRGISWRFRTTPEERCLRVVKKGRIALGTGGKRKNLLLGFSRENKSAPFLCRKEIEESKLYPSLEGGYGGKTVTSSWLERRSSLRVNWNGWILRLLVRIAKKNIPPEIELAPRGGRD